MLYQRQLFLGVMAFTGMMALVTFVLGAAGASDLEVQTVPTVSLVSGKDATLTCGYNRSVFGVYWRYKSDSSQLELLVALDKFYQVGERSGPGYDEGRFDITDDYSLIIHDVQTHGEGTYICEVSDFITGRAVSNSTEVSVNVMAEEPFLRIFQCEGDISTDNQKESCVLHTNPHQRIVVLTCTVVGVKPMVELSWALPDQVEQLLNESSIDVNGDGTFDQSLTLSIDIWRFQTDVKHFTCIAEGLAVFGIANQTITVYVTPNVNKGPSVTGLIAGLSVMSLIVFAVIVCCVLACYLIPDDPKKKLKNQRTNILDYRSANVKDGQCNFNLGVFGPAKSGKSTFINFIQFSLHEQQFEDDHATTTNEAEGSSIEKISLTNVIKIWNYKGTFKERADEFFRQFEGEAKGSGRTHIDCPIFVCSYSRFRTERNQVKKPLPTELDSYFGRVPMVVITNQGNPGQCSQMKDELVQTTGIPRDHIFIFENFTFEDHTVRTSKLLDFISRCLKEGEENKGPDHPPNEESPLNEITSKL